MAGWDMSLLSVLHRVQGSVEIAANVFGPFAQYVSRIAFPTECCPHRLNQRCHLSAIETCPQKITELLLKRGFRGSVRLY